MIQVDSTYPAAIYTRISSDPEDLKLGVQRQEEDCRALAARNGWEVSRVYSDNDLSATKAGVRRPAYEELLADIEAGRVRRLIIDRTDRLYRRNIELERLITIIEGAGHPIEIATANFGKAKGELDLSTTDGRMVARMLGAVAQREAETIRDRVRRKHADIRKNGEWHGGGRPFGWRVEGKKLVEVPEEIALLREAGDRILKGDTLHGIASDWARRDVRSPRNNAIADPVLQRMLESPRLTGEEWDRVRLVMRGKVRPKVTSRKYLLVGLIVCGECGQPMYGRPQSRWKADYVCHPRPGSQACGKVTIREYLVDQFVIDALVRHFTSKDWPYAVRRRKKEAPGMEEAVLALATLQTRFEELGVAYGKGDVSMSEWMAAKRGLDPALRAAEAGLQAAQKAAITEHELSTLDADHFVKHWQDMPLDERRKVAHALVKSVTINPAPGTDERPRISLTWR